MKILLLQGANMVALGKRQPELYGTTTAAQLDAQMRDQARVLEVDLDIRYTNAEGEAIAMRCEMRAATLPMPDML